MNGKKIKKATCVLSGALLLSGFIAILFLSPIAKHLVEKYDVKYTGRELKLNSIYINPFTGYIHIYGLKIFECNSDSIFISASDVCCDISMSSLFSGTLEFSEITLDNPHIIVRQNKKEFNFSDLIKKFTPVKSLTNNKDLRVNLLNLEIKNGTIIYLEPTIPVKYSIVKLHMESTGKMWNEDTINALITLNSGIGAGTLQGKMMLNIKTLRYDFETHFKTFDLSVMEQYLKDITNSASLSASMDADLKATGNLNNPEDIDLEGLIAVNNLHFGETRKEDYLAFKKLSVNIKRLNPKNKKYLFDSISLIEPYLLFERYDTLDNIQNMFGKKGRKITAAKANPEKTNLLFKIADYVKILAKNFFKSNYEVNKISVYGANLRYSDYTMSEKFEIAADPLFLVADSIKRSNRWVEMSLTTNLKPYGKVSVNLSVNPNDSSDFNINYHLLQLPVTVFNPFLVKYTSYPLKRGAMELKGTWNVTNGNIASKNHLTIIDPLISRREKQNAIKILPLRFIMFFARDRGNVIDYEVPIRGDLKKPKFIFYDIIRDALVNLIVKPPTAEYRSEISQLENEIENAFDFSWELNKRTMAKVDEKFLKQLTEHLLKNPSASIVIEVGHYMEREKEHIAFFEAKKLFYLKSNPSARLLDTDDTSRIYAISVKSKEFTLFLNKCTNNKKLHTVQDKCLDVVGFKRIEQLYFNLTSERKKQFLAHFPEKGLHKRIKFTTSPRKVPYNGLSLYSIKYHGIWPEALVKSYNRLNELDRKTPRNKFSNRRRRNKNAARGA